MPAIWSDFYRLFKYEAEPDPLSRLRDFDRKSGVGVARADALSPTGLTGGEGGGSLRSTNEMIDVSTMDNRIQRIAEYQRLRNVPEIEQAITIMTDEACVVGETPVNTPFGEFTIKYLAETKPSDERFLCYSYDFEKGDYCLDWAWNPRKVKTAETIIVSLDDGSKFRCTPDHRVLKRDETWIAAGDLKFGDELMPFYRMRKKNLVPRIKNSQYPRIFTFTKGWTHERIFVDEWRDGKVTEKIETIQATIRLLAAGIDREKIGKQLGHDWDTLQKWMNEEGFDYRELKNLFLNRKDRRRVVGVHPGPVEDVYDISVEKNQCFCTDAVVLHNCQPNKLGDVFTIECENEEVAKEAKWLLLNRKMLNMNRNVFKWFKNLLINGDLFIELCVDPDVPQDGVLRVKSLPPETMFRIETKMGRLVEFQQSLDGPDNEAAKHDPTVTSEDKLKSNRAIRFAPNQIVHFRIGDDRPGFVPYGQSIIEPARGPAHLLRLMEDSMVTYRMTRAPERRIFYIDCGQLPPAKAETLIHRLQDQFRKRKTVNASYGANAVDERWQPMAVDEDFWIPTRPNSTTKVDTLPGAQNLGEIDDAVFFRNKLFVALNFPKNYLASEDVQQTRMMVSAQNVVFSHMLARLQMQFLDGIYEIVERHLHMRGYPEEAYETLKIKMTIPSEVRALAEQEILQGKIANVTQLKGSQMISDYDAYRWGLGISEEETQEMISRLKIQKLEDLKLQVLAANPPLLGVGVPGEDSPANELGAEAGGPGPNLDQPQPGMDQQQPPLGLPAPDQSGQQPAPEQQGGKKSGKPPESISLPEPTQEDIEMYDLEIEDYESEMDHEDHDASVQD